MSKNENEKSSKKRKFSVEEDEQLEKLVEKFGTKNWVLIAEKMKNRNVRQCRERWKYFLSPSVSNKTTWEEEEDKLLLEQVSKIGPHWSKIAKLFKSRSDVAIKNRYRSLQRNNEKFETISSKISKKEMNFSKRVIIELPVPISFLSL